MKIVDEMPTSGSFVMVWEHNGHLFSDDFMYENETLMVLNDADDCWETADPKFRLGVWADLGPFTYLVKQ